MASQKERECKLAFALRQLSGFKGDFVIPTLCAGDLVSEGVSFVNFRCCSSSVICPPGVCTVPISFEPTSSAVFAIGDLFVRGESYVAAWC